MCQCTRSDFAQIYTNPALPNSLSALTHTRQCHRWLYFPFHEKIHRVKGMTESPVEPGEVSLWLQWAWNQALHNCEISIRYLATHESALWDTLHLHFLTVKLFHFTYLLYVYQKMMLVFQMGEIWVVGILEVMEMEAK